MFGIFSKKYVTLPDIFNFDTNYHHVLNNKSRHNQEGDEAVYMLQL